MFDTKTHLRQLLADLERDIQENPDRRLKELATLKAALAALSEEKLDNLDPDFTRPTPTSTPKGLIQSPLVRQMQARREGSKRQQFRTTVDQLLKARIDQRVHRQDIIAKCRELNMFGDTKDLDRDVSKYLSMDGTFAPDGDGFWKKKGPPPMEDDF